MAYTENKSIDWLTAITPTTDDLVVTMDQAEVWVAKTSTLASIYNLFKTTYDTLYAKYLWDADFYKYSITTSVASGNLTVALKNYEGNDPTASKPVKIQIGGVIRTITSALSVTRNSGTNWYNAGSTELATKEIDFFTYIRWNTNGGWYFELLPARIPSFGILSDASATTTYTNEKYLSDTNWWASTDPVVNIGRFNAILSAGAGYTWSIPTYTASNLIQRPIYTSTRKQASTVVTAGSGSITTAGGEVEYTIVNNMVHFNWYVTITTNGTGIWYVNFTLPFIPVWASISYLAGGRSEWWPSAWKQLQMKTNWTNVMSMFTYDNAYPGGDGSSLHFSWSYPI